MKFRITNWVILVSALILMVALNTVRAISVDYGVIHPGQTRSGDITRPSPSDSFNFYGKTGECVIITMTVLSGDLDPKIDLYDPEGFKEKNTWSTVFESAQINNHQLKKTGTYTIICSDYGQTDTGEYNISLTKIPPGDLGLVRPVPQDGAMAVSVDALLSWDGAPGATGYDVYLGKAEPLNRVAENISGTSFDPPGDLDPNSTYLWYVVAHRPGGNLRGPLYIFKTVDPAKKSALALLTPYSDVWAAECYGFSPFSSPARWAWTGFKYDPAGDYPGWPGTFYVVHGDVDGNGTQDLIQFTPYTDVWVALNSGHDLAGPTRWGWLGFYYKERSGNSYFTATGDFNGDGKDDLVQITEFGDAWVATSGISMFNAPTRWGYLGFTYSRNEGKLPLIDDFNGDFKDDIAMVTEYGDVWVSLTGDGSFNNPERWGWLGFSYDPGNGYLPLSGDFNGDGKADLIQITPFQDVWVVTSNGNSFNNPQNWGFPGFHYDENNELYPIAADVNADGKTDLIQITPTGDPWVAISNGSSFEAPQRWGWIGFKWSRTEGYLPMFLGY